MSLLFEGERQTEVKPISRIFFYSECVDLLLTYLMHRGDDKCAY
jgi:hypothetical protein